VIKTSVFVNCDTKDTRVDIPGAAGFAFFERVLSLLGIKNSKINLCYYGFFLPTV